MSLSYQTLDARMTVLEDKIEALRLLLLAVLSAEIPDPPSPPPANDSESGS